MTIGRVRIWMFLLVCLLPLQAMAEAGRVLYSRGTVTVVDAFDSARGAQAGTLLQEGEKVLVGHQSIAQIRLSDGALIALRSNSEYHLEEQQYDEAGGVYAQSGKLLSGWMRVVTGAIGRVRPDAVTYSTEVATIGIRGTVFQLLAIPEEGLADYPNESPGTYLLLEQGEVDIQSASGMRRVRPGQVVFVPPAGKSPRLMPGKKMLFSRALAQRLLRARAFMLNRQLAFLDQTLLDRIKLDVTASVGHVDVFSPYFVCENRFGLVGQDVARRLVVLEKINPQTGDALRFKVSNPLTAVPGSIGAHRLQDGSLVNWGTWAATDYQVLLNGELQGQGLNPWHYMVADRTVTDMRLLANSGPLGVVSYSYVGGTGFTGTLTGLVMDAGSLSIDFRTAAVDAQLQLSLGGVPVNVSAGNALLDPTVGSLGQLYQGGLVISDGAGLNGTMTGAVVGTGTGVMGAINLTTGTQSAAGTALFERQVTVP